MLLTAISAINSIRAVVPTTLMLSVSPTVLIAHTSWRITSLVLPTRWYYPVESAIWAWYQNLTVFFFEQCTGVNLKICGDIPKVKENVVFMCNHQSTMDWVVTDIIAIRQGMVGNIRYVFKNSLKYFPLYGYIWGVHGGIFVSRDGTYNTKHMQSKLQSLKDKKELIYLVIFPEGTRFDTKRTELIAKSQAFALQKRVRPLTNTLTPRVKALHCGLNSLKDYVNAVYDVTIIYNTKNNEKGSGRRIQTAPTMWDILSGKCKDIFLIFNRIPIKNVPVPHTTDAPTFQWLHKRFELKDYQLATFYATSDQAVHNFNTNFPMQNLLKVSFLTTGVSTISLFGLTALLLSTKTGRNVYWFTAVGGTVLCWLYARLFL